MERKEPRRFRLPLLVATEPTVAEGSRSLSRWSELHKDLEKNSALVNELRSSPDTVLARYGLSTTPAELVAALLERIAKNPDFG